jgi:hypothetical protein
MLRLIGMKRRVANKRPCPCGSGLRAGKCHHRILNRLRQELGRQWCREQAEWILENYNDGSEAIPEPTRPPIVRPAQLRKDAEHAPPAPIIPPEKLADLNFPSAA